ncbi:unnamed protein product [Symbiodinium natans]|uniref:Uncharacterized protein n=1 Tax=Symbiodinium natans TaxID=878477 RepID=A0A812NXZ3_9DINO|nr:unnamed protein product [Symbiodinium natans]
MALSAYADDVCRKILVSSPQSAAAHVRFSNEVLDDELLNVGMAQNTDKQEHVVVFLGPHSRTHNQQVYRHALLDGKTVPAAKYLGGLQRYDGQCGPEVDKRANAAYAAWCTFKGLWHRRELPWRGPRTVFMGMVYEVLFSGLEALVLGSGHYAKLDRIVAAYGRRLLRGTACEKIAQADGNIKYRSMPNTDVFRHLGVACASTELRIRRLKFLQRLATDPFRHHHVITAFFGTMDFDPEPTVDAEVGLTPRANSYAARLYWKDLQSLAGLDSAHWIVELAGNDIMAFFTELATDFAHVDVTELRAQELSVQIPPPGFSPAPRQHHAEEPLEMDDLPHVCSIALESGIPCGQRFASLRDLRLHQYKSGLSNHNIVSDYCKVPVLLAVVVVVLWLRLPLFLLTSYASFADMILMIYRSVRALSPREDEQLIQKAVLLVSKMTLRQELEVRELQSAVFKTFMLKALKETIVAHRAAMTSPDKIADIVYIAKMKKAFNRGEFKLFLAVSPSHHDLLEAVCQGVLGTGAVEKKGQAPASGMARELQSLVDKLTEMTAK